MKSYVLWANKGGIGKSTLTFQLACKYARMNQDEPVFIIDLSPQCDVSRMVLGGGHHDGEGKILKVMESAGRKTVYQYLRSCVRDVPSGLGWPDVHQFIVKPNELRDEDAIPLPENLHLFCGDFDLERITGAIDQMPEAEGRGGFVETGSNYSKPLLARSFLRKAVKDIEHVYPNSAIFIDTDPYYSVVTTHIGLLAADSWITAYSPASQASQYAVYRSLEFLHNARDSLSSLIESQKEAHPKPWHDSREGQIEAPELHVPHFEFLISNMTTSKSAKGEPRYSRPQQLHAQAIERVNENVVEVARDLGLKLDYKSDHLWSLQRLGLICDYNGIDMSSVTVGRRYPQPDVEGSYSVARSEDNRLQVDAYNARLEEFVREL
ncbi:ParA family protein [Pseudomonas aeruginosa]|uniref:ParA family protein n=2 Tax=Pseudomonas aeruginosa TaxID=287 RepID=UPI000340FE50|nr:AAA family ATPase [Pseudomonas aeruginosa]EOT13129.1 hypothetical protein PAK_03828 [Pseudomonas aeruginosa PAK]ERX51014.1 hypothetical protein Q002_02907 [Pseudomonas aeruginosa CF18]KSE97407.2 ATPase [Pseudomonas aeruginosa]MBG5228340.1 AAA family ATPase [Pseudomonas aeruginosa]MBG6353393.1 AAA family ATPase [Pseudomonas aeruginosa]